MSGRYAIISSREMLESEFSSHFEFDYYPRMNAFPSVELPVITSLKPDTFMRLRWGLVPYWAKNENIAHYTFNARAEKIFSTPSFRVPIMKRRCLVPANCYFEWQTRQGTSHPYLVYCRDQDIFAFAGIWDTWMNPETERIIRTFSIVTVPARSPLDSINDRSPVILKPEHRERWLNLKLDRRSVGQLLRPYDSRQVNAWPISTSINNPMNEDTKLLQPVGGALIDDHPDIFRKWTGKN